MEWKQVINKRNKNYKQYIEYYNRTYIGKFQTINNKYYLKDILNFESNNTIIEIIDFSNNIIIDDDIIEVSLLNYKNENNILYLNCSIKNIIRRKYNIIYGIVKKFTNDNIIIYTYFLNNNTKMIYINNKNLNLKLYDKIIGKIINYDNNVINIDILKVIGNLYNNNEILDTLVIENNYINLKELLDKEKNNINNKNIFLNYFTNFENIKLDNSYIKNYTNINSNIPIINNKNHEDLYCYINNNDCLFFKILDNKLIFSYSVNHFISNKNLYNNNLQIFYRILNINNNTDITNENYYINLNNNIKKYYNKYKNFSFIKNIQKDIKNKNFITFNIVINLDNNIIEKSYYSYSNITLIDNNFYNNYVKKLINTINSKNIYIKKYFYLNNIDTNVFLLNEYISYVLYTNIKNLIDIIPIKKINNYDYINSINNNTTNTTNISNNSYLNVLKNKNTIVTNYINLYKPYNLYWINNYEFNKYIDSFLNINSPYNNFFDSYLINIFINILNNNEKIFLKNIDKNYLKNLENMNISEKICYKIENTYNIDLLLNILNNNKQLLNNTYNSKIIKIKQQGIFINTLIKYNDINYNFVNSIHISLLSHYPLYYKNNTLENEYISYVLENDILVKIDSFDILNRTINILPLI